LNDSETSYQYKFYLYEGKAENRPADVPATLWPVQKLFGEQFRDKNHVLYTDNWYTSMKSVQYIANLGNHATGTCLTNKTGLPDEGKFAKKKKGETGVKKKRERGEMKQMKKTINGKSYYFTAWMDNKGVHMLSTLPTFMDTVARNCVDEAGKFSKRTINRPTLVRDYNRGMGGTDGIDQRGSYYRPKVKTVTWIPKIIVHLLDIAVVNAFILYREYMKPNKRYVLKNFLMDLIEELVAEERALSELPNASVRRSGAKRLQAWSKDQSRLIDRHFPQIIIHPKVDKKGRKRNRLKQHCMLCNLDVTTRCKQCDIGLCIAEIGDEMSCFHQFHTRRDISGGKERSAN
jgi:hypothetical protein